MFKSITFNSENPLPLALAIASKPLNPWAIKVTLCALGILLGLAAGLCFFMQVNVIATYTLCGAAAAAFLAASIVSLINCNPKPLQTAASKPDSVKKKDRSQNFRKPAGVAIDSKNRNNIVIHNDAGVRVKMIRTSSQIAHCLMHGKEIISVDANRTITYWDLKTGERLKKYENLAPYAGKFCVLEDGRLVWAVGNEVKILHVGPNATAVQVRHLSNNAKIGDFHVENGLICVQHKDSQTVETFSPK